MADPILKNYKLWATKNALCSLYSIYQSDTEINKLFSGAFLNKPGRCYLAKMMLNMVQGEILHSKLLDIHIGYGIAHQMHLT